MPEYRTDETTGLPVSGIPEPTPAASLAGIDRSLADLAARMDRIMRQLAREIARWPRPIPPDQWERLVDEVTERLKGERPDGDG